MLKPNTTLAATLLACASITTAQSATIPNLGDDSCDSLLLVSSWTRNNVKIYDGCSGEFIRDLDSQNLIDGPLGILEAPDGDLLVISESNNRLLKFDRQTLSVGSAIMEVSATKSNFIGSPSGAVIDDDGFMYAASYGTNKVVKIDTSSWAIVDEMLPANNGLVEGIDAGLTISDDGYLYIPGYDSDNIIKLNLQTKEATVAVAASTGGLEAPRTILIRGDEMLVTAERSNAILVFDVATGAFKQTLVEVSRPTGLRQDGDSHFLVNTSTAVYRVTNDGTDFEKVVQNGAGDLAGGTFVYRIHKTGVDSDGDGLSNEDETNLHHTDPTNADTDGDNLSDGDEINTHHTNPLKSDSDDDAMPDDYEITNGLQANTNDAGGDLDGDGLTNLEEYQLGTAANNPDTDGDGENDATDPQPLTANYVLTLAGTPTASIEQDANYNFTPEVSYTGDLATLSFSISNPPQWASFDQTSGKLSGTPGNSDVGNTSNIVITVTTGFEDIALNAFDLAVINVNDAPTLVSDIGLKTFTEGDSISIDISSHFTDIDALDSLVFSADGLPAGITISEAGVISGDVSVVTITPVSVTATDLGGASAIATFDLHVQSQDPGPVVTPVVDQSSGGGGGSTGGGLLLMLSLLIGGRRLARA
jgi:hypothetical protein